MHAKGTEECLRRVNRGREGGAGGGKAALFSLFVEEGGREGGSRGEEKDGSMHRVRVLPTKKKAGKEGKEEGKEEGVFRRVVSKQVIPGLKSFSPQLILLSIDLDVLGEVEGGLEGGMGLGGGEVGGVVRQVQGVADVCSGGKMVCVVEGGREGGREGGKEGEAVVALVKGLVDPYVEEEKEEEEGREEGKEDAKKGRKEEGLIMGVADCDSGGCRTSQ